MYIARVGGRLIVKRMPNTGSQHAPGCVSYAHVLEASDRDRPSAGESSRVGFALVERAVSPLRRPGGSWPAAAGARVGLGDLLARLWVSAGLVEWAPGWEGRRTWSVVASRLRRAVDQSDLPGLSPGVVFVPEPFRSSDRDAIAARREVAWGRVCRRRGQRGGPLLVLLGEVKALEPARFGTRMVIRHLPGAPLYLSQVLDGVMRKRFPVELDLWKRVEGVRLVVMATFSVTTGGSAVARELTLMASTAQWLPVRDSASLGLVDRLVGERRRFTLAAHPDPLWAAEDSVAAVLTDTRPWTTLAVSRAASGSSVRGSGPGSTGSRWVWREGMPMPALPPRSW